MTDSRFRVVLVLSLVLTLSSILGSMAAATGPSDPESAGDTEGSPQERLADLFARAWKHQLAENPLLATSLGRRGAHDRLLPDSSLAAHARRAKAARAFLTELETIDHTALDADDMADAEVFRWQQQQVVDEFAHHQERLPLTSDTGFHVGFGRLPAEVPLATADDYAAYIARLEAFPRWVDDHIELLRAGKVSNHTLPRVTLESIDAAVSAQLVDSPSASPFFAPFRAFPEFLEAATTEAERESLRADGEAATRTVIESYRRFLDFLRTEYAPAARETIGASSMPEGDSYYAHRVRHYTTLDLTPEEVHQIGLDEVARIRAEMTAVITRAADAAAAAGDTSVPREFDAFVAFLRSDPRFYADSPRALLEYASYLSKRIDGRLPTLFAHLPRLPYGVEPVPAEIAPYYTAGRYVPGALDGTRAGTYWVNTHDLPSRPLYALPALTLHEAVPGHHLQISLAQQMDQLPPFRRELYISAYGEGWALYAERLGVEVDFYEDAYADFGRLTYEMWRACRLVVDTGIHAMSWSRQQAIDYLAGNTALSLREVETEIDRYISWPGQALAYKMGEITIQRLRREAEADLGPDFDLRTFHDTVLGTGSVPLPVLENVVGRWVAGQLPTPTH
ncbi:MAG: DUF885 family protein [Acidobacteriota bacterium]